MNVSAGLAEQWVGLLGLGQFGVLLLVLTRWQPAHGLEKWAVVSLSVTVFIFGPLLVLICLASKEAWVWVFLANCGQFLISFGKE